MIPRHAKSILLVRLSARGDVVFASPLAAAIKRSRPDVHLCWIAEERTADVIQHNPHIDEVIVWERARWKALLKGGKLVQLFRHIRTFRRTLRRGRFDVAIDAQGLLRSGAVAFLSGAPLRIGLGSREGSRLLMTRVLPLGGDEREISSEYKHLARQLRLDPAGFDIEIPPGPANEAFVEELVMKEGLESGYVVASPFTTRHFKHWFEDRWSEVLGQLRDRTGRRVVLLGGPDDRPAAERILAGVQTDAGIVDLVGRTTLGQASAVVARSDLLVGVDTGLSHMAHGYGRPAVLLFGSNTPYLDPPTPQAQILHSGRDCSPCRGRLTCDGRIDCMRDLTVDDALDAIQRGLT
ncbi:MAG: glycosyltransferase family 9 protein [Longimicrobiales bacterium]